MTEEIIIDGVNVAGCNFRLERDNKQKCECCHATGFGVICDCEAWHNCYYKQLQHIKQQNLEIIERANAYPKIVILANERLNEITRLEQERDEYKECFISTDTNAKKIQTKLFEKEELCKELEQENKELKEKIIKLSEEKGHLIVENNTLKESNQSLSMLGTDLASANETVRKEFFRADKNKDMWREKAEEYRSALKEVKSMFQEKCTKCYKEEKPYSCGECELAKFLRVINEVLG